MTPLRVVLVIGALWIGLVLLALFGAWVEPDTAEAAAYAHAAWMFVLAGGTCAAAGLLLALTVALINEVRTARSLGQRPPRRLHRQDPVETVSVRREGAR
jgi:hypothetical protein